MIVDPVSSTSCIEFKSTDVLTNLFRLAYEDKWDDVYTQVKKNPSLLNAKFKEGQGAGITVLWIASSLQTQLAIEFIKTVFDLKIPFDMNAMPLKGPDLGKTVFWNFAFLSRYNKFFIDHIETFLKNFDCDINSAPKEGPKKDVTAYCLLAEHPAAITAACYYPIIRTSAVTFNYVSTYYSVPSSLLKIILTIENNPEYFESYFKDLESETTKKKLYSKDKILINCYQNLIKSIEETSTRELNRYCCNNPLNNKSISLLEAVLSLKLSTNRNTLFLCLIFAGAQSDTMDQAIKEEYENILKRLISVYKRSLEFIKCQISLQQLPIELIRGTAYNIILTEFPEVKNVPLSLINNYFKGISLS